LTLADLTHGDFEKHLNRKVPVRHEAGETEMELVECRKLGPRAGVPGMREPFALLFRGPMKPLLPQRMYEFRFDGLGPLEIFIVPVGPDELGMRYEAIFA